jgi:hypothetical protein
MKTNRMTPEQVVAGRAKVVAEIDALDAAVGPHSAYALALADGTRAMPRELSHLFASRIRWEELTTLRRRWEAADAEAKHARMVRENDR